MMDRMKLEWQPIETAPKDGRRVIIAIEGCPRAQISEWDVAAWVTIMAGRDWIGHKVTHWMPLPEPPSKIR
jgi:hypothetical protein